MFESKTNLPLFFFLFLTFFFLFSLSVSAFLFFQLHILFFFISRQVIQHIDRNVACSRYHFNCTSRKKKEEEKWGAKLLLKTIKVYRNNPKFVQKQKYHSTKSPDRHSVWLITKSLTDTTDHTFNMDLSPKIKFFFSDRPCLFISCRCKVPISYKTQNLDSSSIVGIFNSFFLSFFRFLSIFSYMHWFFKKKKKK